MKLLTVHLRENDISYFTHMRRAISISLRLLFAAITCAIHAIFPFVFTSWVSTTVKDIAKEIKSFEENYE